MRLCLVLFVLIFYLIVFIESVSHGPLYTLSCFSSNAIKILYIKFFHIMLEKTTVLAIYSNDMMLYKKHVFQKLSRKESPHWIEILNGLQGGIVRQVY